MTPTFDQYPQHIDKLIQSALEAVSPETAVRRFLGYENHIISAGDSSYDIDGSKVFLVGAGKAAIRMGIEASRILGRALTNGILITKDTKLPAAGSDLGSKLPDNVEVYRASHPVSDMRGVEATRAVLDLLSDTEETDLVICLISGGASALLTRPIIPLDDWQQLITALLDSGCTINELNTVRRQIDLVKGGGLLKHAAPASCVSLILSDVVGNPLEVIGSGPTVQFQESPEDARAVMQRYRITRHLPREVWGRIDEALNNLQQERPVGTVKVNNIIIGDVCQAAMASEVAAQELGFQTQLLTCTLEGEARDVGMAAAALARDLYPGSCLVLGGETTVTVKGKGIGGRNQELALAAAIAMEGLENVVVASFATDGEDGLTKAAGAAVTGSSASSARLRGLDPQALLDKNDSFSFFSRLGGLLETGSTGTNVNDLLFILKYES